MPNIGASAGASAGTEMDNERNGDVYASAAGAGADNPNMPAAAAAAAHLLPPRRVNTMLWKSHIDRHLVRLDSGQIYFTMNHRYPINGTFNFRLYDLGTNSLTPRYSITTNYRITIIGLNSTTIRFNFLDEFHLLRRIWRLDLETQQFICIPTANRLKSSLPAAEKRVDDKTIAFCTNDGYEYAPWRLVLHDCIADFPLDSATLEESNNPNMEVCAVGDDGQIAVRQYGGHISFFLTANNVLHRIHTADARPETVGRYKKGLFYLPNGLVLHVDPIVDPAIVEAEDLESQFQIFNPSTKEQVTIRFPAGIIMEPQLALDGETVFGMAIDCASINCLNLRNWQLTKIIIPRINRINSCVMTDNGELLVCSEDEGAENQLYKIMPDFMVHYIDRVTVHAGARLQAALTSPALSTLTPAIPAAAAAASPPAATFNTSEFSGFLSPLAGVIAEYGIGLQDVNAAERTTLRLRDYPAAADFFAAAKRVNLSSSPLQLPVAGMVRFGAVQIIPIVEDSKSDIRLSVLAESVSLKGRIIEAPRAAMAALAAAPAPAASAAGSSQVYEPDSPVDPGCRSSCTLM